MLFEYLEQVRQQSKEARRRFAFIWSLIITGFIVIVWISVIFGRSYALREPEPSIEEQIEMEAQDIRNSFDTSNRFLFESVSPEPTQSPVATSTTLETPDGLPETDEAQTPPIEDFSQTEDVKEPPVPAGF